MTHLTPDELIDALEAADGQRDAAPPLAADRLAHLAGCDLCRQQLADLSSTLNDASQVSVPEPSPLFWTHFSSRVRAAVEQEPGPDEAWPSFLRWQFLLPLGAVAAVILALMIAVPKPAADEPPALASVAAESPASPDHSWNTVVDLVGPFDLETASAAGVIAPGVAEAAVLQLTAEEQLELTRLLKAELSRAKS